jgi:hypothetical protein
MRPEAIWPRRASRVPGVSTNVLAGSVSLGKSNLEEKSAVGDPLSGGAIAR